MSVSAARLTAGSSDWLALGDGRYGNELRQQQQPMPPALSPCHSRPATAGDSEYVYIGLETALSRAEQT